MARLRVLSGREACRILETHGFSEARRKGSHVAMQKRGAGSTVTVIVPDHKELRIGTLQSIIRQSGLPRVLFELAGPTSVREPKPRYRARKAQTTPRSRKR